MPTAHADITVDVPIEDAFRLWNQYERIPHFMSNVKEVKKEGENEARFTLGEGDRTMDYRARIEREENRRFAWRATEQPALSGEVRFERKGDNETKIVAKVDWERESDIKERFLDLFQIDDAKLYADLRDFKKYAEREIGAITR